MGALNVLWINPTTMDTLLHNKALVNALTELSELGNKVTLVSIRSRDMPRPNSPRFHMVLFPLRYVPIFSSLMFAVILSFWLPWLILTFKPDRIIFAPDVSVFSSLPIFIFKKTKTKFILDVRSTPVETAGFRGFMAKFWFSASIFAAKKWFNGFTILTQPMKMELSKGFLLPQNRIGVWTSGVSTDLFNPNNVREKIPELRGKLGLTGKFVVFYHGIFTPSRGLVQTVEAIEKLVPLYPDIVLFLLGKGSLDNYLKTTIREHGLQDIVIIHEPVSQTDVPMFIAMSDVGIVPLPDQPYWRNQSPLKLLEYLAMEKAVILTDIPAHRNVIGDQVCGIFISSIEPTDIFAAIECVYNNRANLKYFGASGRRIVEKNYTWRKIAEALDDYLLTVS